MAHLLLIDDDPGVIPEQVRAAFPAPGHRLRVATDGAAGLAHMQNDLPDVVLLDLHLPDGSGLQVYEQIRRIDARVPVIFITMVMAADAAIEAMKSGAFNYLHKPLDLAQLRATVSDAIEVGQRMREPAAAIASEAPDPPLDPAALLGCCAAMLEVYKAIGRVAGQNVTVLITGESGTGKEVVARSIYQHSTRASAPFLALNCAAIPEALLESELFGHEKGAFTGADRRRIGKFEQCDGGTLLLDEIGDMPLILQAKVLRVLQDQVFERVGGTESIRTNVRLIAATHRDLKARVAEEKFRADLYYRLSVFTIQLPPLRERGEDLPMLVKHYVRRFSEQLGRDVRDISAEALAQLAAYDWPGNVRELQSTIKQALLVARGPTLVPAFLPSLAARTPPPARSAGFELEASVRQLLQQSPGDVHAETHRQVDRLLFKLALEHTGGNYSEAARVLGISRQTMRVRLRALGLHVAHSVASDEDDSSVV